MIDPGAELVVQAVPKSFRSVLRLVRDRRCVTALEFALIAPVLLFLMFSLMDIMWMLSINMAMTYTLEEGARLGSLGTLPLAAQGTAITAYMAQRSGGILSAAQLVVTPLIYGDGSAHAYATRNAATPGVTGTTPANFTGTTHQFIEYNAAYTLKQLSPVAFAYGGQATFLTHAKTVVQNEPY